MPILPTQTKMFIEKEKSRTVESRGKSSVWELVLGGDRVNGREGWWGQLQGTRDVESKFNIL